MDQNRNDAPNSSGAAAMKSRHAVKAGTPSSAENIGAHNMTVGPTGCAWNSKDVTTPKLPPPPRRPQNRSAFSDALATLSSPLAVTTSAESRLSMLKPRLRICQPVPPPNVRPATPVLDTTPDGTASPK